MIKIKSKNIKIEKFHNLYTKKNNNNIKKKKYIYQKGGAITKTNNIKDNLVFYIEVSQIEDNINESFFIKFYHYPVKQYNNTQNKLKTLLNKNIDISSIQVGEGYYEGLFYDKFYNLTKNIPDKIKIVRPYKYGFINNNPEIITITKNGHKFELDLKKFVPLLYNKNINTDDYFSFLITEFMPNVKTFNDYYNKNNGLDSKMKELVKKTKSSLDYAYTHFGFIHCDLHWGNILVNVNTDDIYIFDFGLSEIGGINNIPLLSSNIQLYYNLDYYFNIFYPLKQWDTSKKSFNNTIKFKKNIIYKELFHAYDYFRLIIENYNYNIFESQKYLFDLNKYIIYDIIKLFNLTDINSIKLLYKLFIDKYEFNKLFICGIFYYCSIYPKSILIKQHNINKPISSIQLSSILSNLNKTYIPLGKTSNKFIKTR